MVRPEHPLARAERQVREGEERAACLAAIVERLERVGDGSAEAARMVLASVETGVGLARDRLCAVRARAAGGVPRILY